MATWNVHQLKVDQSAIPYQDQYLLLTHVNIPEDLLFNDIENTLNRVQTFIVQEYNAIDNVLYQVCATYELKNTKTNAIKVWTGSFNPRNNALNALNDFTKFDASFKRVVRETCHPDTIFARFRSMQGETSWVFQRIISFFFSFQAILDNQHPTLRHRRLLVYHGEKVNRKRNTFHLP